MLMEYTRTVMAVMNMAPNTIGNKILLFLNASA